MPAPFFTRVWKVPRGLRRQHARITLWRLREEGFSGSAALRELRRVGLGYRAEVFWRDWHAVVGSFRVKGWIKRTPYKQLVPREHIPEAKFPVRKRYRYLIEYDVYNPVTGVWTTDYKHGYSNRLLSDYEARKMSDVQVWRESLREVGLEFKNPRLADITHNEGWTW